MPSFVGPIVTFIPEPGFEAELQQGPVLDWLVDVLEQAKSLAQQYAPVDTGELQQSIDVDLELDGEELEGVLGAEAEHAPFQELGTVHHPPHPFLRPAMLAVLQGQGMDEGDIGFSAVFDEGGVEEV